MTGRIRLDRGELPWAPLVPGGEGLNRHPEEPVALRQRMAEVYGVPSECICLCRGAVHGSALAFFALGGIDIVDESTIEFSDHPSRAGQAAASDAFVVVRDLTTAYGLAGAPCGAIIGSPANIARIEDLRNPSDIIDTPVARLAAAALDPSRQLATMARIEAIKAERERLRAALRCAPSDTNQLVLKRAKPAMFERFGLVVEWLNRTTAWVTIGTPEQNDLVLAAMGVPVPPRAPARRAEVVRDTKETRIVATVDLDRAEPVHIATGIGFYDHMLEQIARHGGFSLTLAAEGDLHIEAHHTIEDSALALGEALRQALGDRKGVARFGFVAPLDEAEAAVTLDLSGRPFVKFEGDFKRAMIGDYPTEMTSHVFRSLADAMRATIHVEVTGEDDHHKTEAAFKSFGRALRQAIRVEGDQVPSTKGVLA